MKHKYFELQTSLGLLYFQVVGPNAIYVSNSRDDSYPHPRTDITIRGKVYTYGNFHFTKVGNQFDGQCYGWDGNTLTNVGSDEMFKVRATTLSSGVCTEATSAAKKKFYDETLKALNAFYAAHREEIDAEMASRAKERNEKAINALETKIASLTEELNKAQSDLAKLKGE